MQDTKRRLVLHRSAQFVGQTFLVGVGHRQPEDAVPVAVRGECVDQWPHDNGVIADQQPRGRPRRTPRRGVRSGFLPADLVADVGDRLRTPLSVMLCGKLVQYIGGVWVTGRTVEQRGELLDPAVLEQPDGFGAGAATCAAGGLLLC